MPDLGQALREHLITRSGVTNLIGERIGPAPLWQDETQPAANYQMISSVVEHDLSGYSNLTFKRVWFRAFGSTRLQANSIADKIFEELVPNVNGSTGIDKVSIGSTANRVFIQGIQSDGERDYDETPVSSEAAPRYVREHDFLISYST